MKRHIGKERYALKNLKPSKGKRLKKKEKKPGYFCQDKTSELFWLIGSAGNIFFLEYRRKDIFLVL